MRRIDYLTIGHVSRDLTPDGPTTGGTVSFSSRTAQVLGYQTAALTSSAPDYDLSQALDGVQVHRLEAEATTTFENIYTPRGRQQFLHAVARRITAGDVPPEWQRVPIVHLAPIANEVEPEMIYLFSNSIVGLTSQGWLRRWDENGRVYTREWPDAPAILPLAAAVVLSEEDLLDEAMLHQYRAWARLLVLTQAKAGCTVFWGQETRQIPAPEVAEVEPTGAGDIFAAAFFIRLHQTAGDAWEAARYANKIAAQSVTAVGLEAKIARIKQFQDDQDLRDH
jgi:sugar/nucleoside kinase (ribokinase family)